jgi:hypothetical protein
MSRPLHAVVRRPQLLFRTAPCTYEHVPCNRAQEKNSRGKPSEGRASEQQHVGPFAATGTVIEHWAGVLLATWNDVISRAAIISVVPADRVDPWISVGPNDKFVLIRVARCVEDDSESNHFVQGLRIAAMRLAKHADSRLQSAQVLLGLNDRVPWPVHVHGTLRVHYRVGSRSQKANRSCVRSGSPHRSSNARVERRAAVL